MIGPPAEDQAHLAPQLDARPAGWALAGDVAIEQALGIMKVRGEPVISQLAVERLARLRRVP